MENLCAIKEDTATPCKLDSRTPILHPVVLGAPETSIYAELCQNDTSLITSKLSTGDLLKSTNFKWVLFMCLLLTMIAVAISLFVSTSYTPSIDIPVAQLQETSLNFDDNTTRIYTRSQWFGVPGFNTTKPLQHPTEYVIVSHTGGTSCNDFPSCSAKTRNVQTYQMQILKAPDIGYNFLIGGDGDVYVGRGWDTSNNHKNESISISVIGDYSVDKMTQRMVSALEYLLQLGVKLGKLSTAFKLLCHNQVAATISPGPNACKKVSQLPHYFAGHVSL